MTISYYDMFVLKKTIKMHPVVWYLKSKNLDLKFVCRIKMNGFRYYYLDIFFYVTSKSKISLITSNYNNLNIYSWISKTLEEKGYIKYVTKISEM